MIRILHSVSNMDRAGIETMLMNYYRYMDKSKVQFDFLCNKKKPGAYDDEIKYSMSIRNIKLLRRTMGRLACMHFMLPK